MTAHGCRPSPSVRVASDAVLPRPSLHRRFASASALRACCVDPATARRVPCPADVSRQTYPFSLPDLPYAYDALEPHIDEATLRIHHREHHATYVKKLNEALAKEPRCSSSRSADCCATSTKLPEAVRTAVKNNGGGHLNHDLFWRSLSPAPSPRTRAPRGALGEAIERAVRLIRGISARSSAMRPRNISRAAGWRCRSSTRTQKLAIVDLKDHEVLQAREPPQSSFSTSGSTPTT